MNKCLVIIGMCVLLLFLTSALFGQTDIGFKGVGAKIGFVDPEGTIGSTVSFGAVVDLGIITSNIALDADIMYWAKSYGPGDDFKVSSIGLSVMAKYLFDIGNDQLKPYSGAGLGFTRTGWSSDYVDPLTGESLDDSDFDLAIHLAGGTKYLLSEQLDTFAEFRYSIAGDADFWGLFVGLVYKLE
jgi:opacity protein-like surface antigen